MKSCAEILTLVFSESLGPALDITEVVDSPASGQWASDIFVVAMRRATLDRSGEDPTVHGVRGGGDEVSCRAESTLENTGLVRTGLSATFSSVSQRR